MPAHSSVAKVMQGTAFRRLATKAGESCGLWVFPASAIDAQCIDWKYQAAVAVESN